MTEQNTLRLTQERVDVIRRGIEACLERFKVLCDKPGTRRNLTQEERIEYDLLEALLISDLARYVERVGQ